MAENILFNRFEVGRVIQTDDVFRYLEAKDLEQDQGRVWLAQLNEPWSGNQTIVNELISYFEPLQNLKAKEIVPVLLMVGSARDGFAVVMKPPSGVNLSDIGEIESQMEAERFIDGLCDAIHKSNVKGVVHGYLRKQDVWIDDGLVKICGFGYGVVLRHGWEGAGLEVAPEFKIGEAPSVETDVYALARLIKECFPGDSHNAVLEKARERLPANRYPKIRVFQAELIRSWGSPSSVGVVPKETSDTKHDSNTSGQSTVEEQDTSRQQNVSPHNKYIKDWLYFDESEFRSGIRSQNELFSKINRVFFNNRLRCADSAISGLNYILEVPGFYEKWLKYRGGTPKPSESIVTLEEKTKGFRNQSFDRLIQENQESVVCLNRLLVEITYPELCPIHAEAKKASGRTKVLVGGVLLALMAGGGYVWAQYHFKHKVFDNLMVEVSVGEYQPTPYLSRYLGRFADQSVVIDQPFSIQIGEVTVGEFRQYVENLDKDSQQRIGVHWKEDLNGEPYSNNRPVDYISSRDAREYARWLGRKNGVEMRLPTYEQWAASVIKYSEDHPVLASKENMPLEELRSQPDHLIGNLREWSSELCGNNKYRLLGEDYMSDMESLGELPCVKDTRRWKGTGFRLVRIGR